MLNYKFAHLKKNVSGCFEMNTVYNIVFDFGQVAKAFISTLKFVQNYEKSKKKLFEHRSLDGDLNQLVFCELCSF